MPLLNTDRFVVQRGNTLYKVDSSTLKQEYSGTSLVTISADPPKNPAVGTLWWSTLEGNLFIWYSDGNSSQWVDASPAFIEIDYTRIENFIDFSVSKNAVAQVKPGDNWVTVSPANGKDVVTVDLDLTDYTEYQQRQDDRIAELESIVRDLADRLDQLEDDVAGLTTIDGGYPNAEGVFDEPETDGGNANPASQTPPDIGGGNAEGYD